MVLSQSQTLQLNKEIVEYLANNGYSASATAFAEEVGLSSEVDPDGKQLELRFKSIVSLQRKINALEDEVKSLKEQLTNCRGAPKEEVRAEEAFLPQTPAKHALKGHRANVTSLAFHPQYTQVASTSEDGSVKLWDFENGEYERTLKGHTGSVSCVNFSNNGKFLVSCSSDLTVKLWELSEYQCAKTFYGHNHSVSWAAFVLDDECIISCSRDKTIKLWEIATGFCKRTFIGHEDWVRQVVATPDSKTLASCSSDQTVMLWAIDKEAPIMTLTGHDNVIESVLFIEGDRAQFLASSEFLRTKFKTPTLQSLKQAENGVQAQAPQRLFLVSASRDKSIRLWNCSNGQTLHTFMGHDTWVRSLAVHPTGKWLYSASDDKTVRIWDLNFGKQKKRVEAHEHFVSSVRHNPRYAVLATTGQDMTIKIWTLK